MCWIRSSWEFDRREAQAKAAQADPLAQAHASQNVIAEQTALAEREADLTDKRLESAVRRLADAQAYKRPVAHRDPPAGRWVGNGVSAGRCLSGFFITPRAKQGCEKALLVSLRNVSPAGVPSLRPFMPDSGLSPDGRHAGLEGQGEERRR